MLLAKFKKMSLASRFYLTLLIPLIFVSVAVTNMTFIGLENNAANLAKVLAIESKANRILSLLLVQDDATKALLIDPAQLETFSTKKIDAYDEHKKLLAEVHAEAGPGEIQDIITALAEIDENKLRPIDTKVLEKLFDNIDDARNMYFEQYEKEKKDYEKLIRNLAEIGTRTLHEAGEELHVKNVNSLASIVLALILGVFIVGATITVLAKQVEKSEENTKSLLAVLEEGLFFFDAAGRIADERSQALSSILQDSDKIKTLQNFFASYTKIEAANVETCLGLLWNQEDDGFFSDFSTTISLLPPQFTIGGDRTISLSYRPLYNTAKQLQRVIVVVSDVTEKLKRERNAVLQAERVKKISRVAADTQTYFSFMDESIALFRRADRLFASQGKLAPDELTQLKRDLHTIKGSIGTFDFNQLASQIHELETLLEEQSSESERVKSVWERIKDQWKFETTDIDQVLGLKTQSDKMTMLRSKFEKMQAHARSSANETWLSLLEDSLRYPIQEVFSKYESYLDKQSQKYGDKQVRLSFALDSADFSHQEIQSIDGALIHIFRNCLDHGIEDVESRQKAHKAAYGTIHISGFRLNDGGLHIVIKDDGQGINAEKLAQKALDRGIWKAEKARTASHQEKVELIFQPNLSTKDSVTELSGRGVGMDAVKDQVEKLGGRITVHSQPNIGTQFELDLPTAKSNTLLRKAS